MARYSLTRSLARAVVLIGLVVVVVMVLRW